MHSLVRYQSLSNWNFRRYLAGFGVSNVGVWLQQTAELWVILQLTNSGTAVGLHSLLRFGPVLVFGAYGGLISDRFDCRRLLITTQSGYCASAVLVAIASIQRTPPLLLIYVAVLWQGLVNAVDNPLKRAFIRDLVSDGALTNAASLHGSIGTVTRAVGPALAGLIIATKGVLLCFALNAASFVGIVVVLLTLDRSSMRHQDRAPRAPRQLRQGIRYAWNDSGIRSTLLLCIVVGIFGWNWTVLMPFYSTSDLNGGAPMYGALLTTVSLGSFIGALITANVKWVTTTYLLGWSALLGVGLTATALTSQASVAFPALLLVGMAGTAVIVGSQARILGRTDGPMSGRILALYSVSLVGAKPIGGILGGWLTELGGARTAFGFGAIIVVLATFVLYLALRLQDLSKTETQGA